MDFARLADDLLGIVKAAAPLVGLSEEVETAERLLSSARGAYETIKDALGSDDRAALEGAIWQAMGACDERLCLLESFEPSLVPFVRMVIAASA